MNDQTSAIADSSAIAGWHDEADVVVVGFGGAGAVAAIEAREQGADVLVLDRFHGGGATAISGGVFYSGGGTPIQQAAGVEDSVEAMEAYLRLEVKDAVSPETLHDFCARSIENLTWLQRHGVPFEPSLCPVKTSYPTDRYYLYYSGNESFPPFRDAARPAARGHRAKGTGLPGANFYEPLRASALALGVRASYETKAVALIHDDSGAVIGVEVRSLPEGSAAQQLHRKLNQRAIRWKNYNPGYAKRCWKRCESLEQTHGVTRRIRARRGVVLSAGGFIYNREMVAEHAPGYRPGMPLGTWGDDGSGIRLGVEAGGATERMDRVSAWRFINPPMSWTRGVLLNGEGRRYVNEQLYGAAIGEAMVEDNGGKALLLIDRDLWRASRREVMWGRAQWFQAAPALLSLYTNCRKASTIEELARAIRVPEDALRETIETYNEQARTGAPDPFGKAAEARKVLEPPFRVIDCSITSKRFPCPTLTLGGLRVDEQSGLVRRADGSTVPGLYAAGRTAAGVCSQQYVSGLSIADCVYSGRRAGQHAATAGA